MKDRNLKYHSTDQGHCSIYYTHEETIFCFTLNNDGLRFYECTDEGEPSHEVSFESVCSIDSPPDDNHYQEMNDCIKALKIYLGDFPFPAPKGQTWVDIFRVHVAAFSMFELANFFEMPSEKITRKVLPLFNIKGPENPEGGERYEFGYFADIQSLGLALQIYDKLKPESQKDMLTSYVSPHQIVEFCYRILAKTKEC